MPARSKTQLGPYLWLRMRMFKYISPWLRFGLCLAMWLGGVPTWAIVLAGTAVLLPLAELAWVAPRFRQPTSSLPTDSPSSKFGKILNEMVCELHAPESQSDIEMEILFFHGLDFGDARDAQSREWLSRDGAECWPQKWLPENFPAARILSISYDANVWDSDGLDMRLIAENLMSSLIVSDRVGEGWVRPLVLVGHCVGGLIMKQLCLEVVLQLGLSKRNALDKKRLGDFLLNLRGLFYFSTPHGGSEAAQLFDGSRKRSRIVNSIRLLNEEAMTLEQKFQGLRDQYKDAWEVAGVFELNATKLDGFYGVVVGEASAKIGVAYGNIGPVREDHFGVNQPKDRKSSSYRNLVTFLSRIVKREKEKIESYNLLHHYNEEMIVGLHTRVEDNQSRLQTSTSVGLYGIGGVGETNLTRVEAIETKLEKARSVGLYGMGGVGKTTLARAVFKALSLSKEFEYTCFIADVKELVQKESGQQLIARMLEGLEQYGRARDDADWSTLRGKKVLLVLDDIDFEHQLQAIPWKAGWFGAESRVIATSRDQKLCERLFKDTFHVESLNRVDAEHLFIHHAFEGDVVPSFLTGRKGYLNKILDVCDGVPLALEVVGKCLHKETDEDIWEGAVLSLQEGEPVDGERNNLLLRSLRLSYDARGDEERKMFLDAAILYKDEPLTDALDIWGARWGRTVKGSWQHLKHKCLVREDRFGRVQVHEQLRMLARNISCSKHERKPNWLRVSLPHESRKLLTKASQEPAKAEALIYMPRLPKPALVLDSFTFTETRFPNLLMLNIRGIEIQGEKVNLPSQLVFLSWHGAPHERCPFDLRHLEQLRILKLKAWTALKVVPDGLEFCTSLTKLELEGCKALKVLPNGILKLRKLRFLGLGNTGLIELPSSLGALKDIEVLQLGNTNISRLPDSVGSFRKLTELQLRATCVSFLPEAFGDLVELKTLNLAKTKLSALPSSLGRLTKLTFMDLSNTSLSFLPEAIGDLVNLETLRMSKTRLTALPDSLGMLRSVRRMDLSKTRLSILPESIGDMEELEKLELNETRLSALPNSIGKLQKLRDLYLFSTPLRSLPESLGELRGLGSLFLSDTMVEKLPKSFRQLSALRKLFADRCKSFHQIPAASGDLTSLRYLSLDFYHDSYWGAEEVRDSTENPPQADGDQPPLSPASSSRTQASSSSNPPSDPGSESIYPPGSNSPRAPHFWNLEDLLITDRESVQEFPRNLLRALEHAGSLRNLKLAEFHAVKRLPDDFGSLLPKSVAVLTIVGWSSLEVLPESMGHLSNLDVLSLERCSSLHSLPESLSVLPNLSYLELRGCARLEMWPSSLDPAPSSMLRVYMDSWKLLVKLVESFNYLAGLLVHFVMNRQDWEEMIVEWGPEVKNWAQVTGESALARVEMMRRVYERGVRGPSGEEEELLLVPEISSGNSSLDHQPGSQSSGEGDLPEISSESSSLDDPQALQLYLDAPLFYLDVCGEDEEDEYMQSP